MRKAFFTFLTAAATCLSASGQMPRLRNYATTDTTITETMRSAGRDIVAMNKQQKLDVVIVGELHALTSHDAAKLVLDDYLIDSMGVQTVAFEYPASDKINYGGFYADMDSVCEAAATAHDGPLAWIDDTQHWLANNVAYPYRLLELSQAFAGGANVELIDCERTGRDITQDDMTDEVEALLTSSPYFQNIAVQYPRITRPGTLKADTKDGMVFRNLLMAARIKKLLDENKGPVLSHNGRSHLHDRKLSKIPQLDEMLAEMGFNVATVDMGCTERGGNAMPADLYEADGRKTQIIGSIFVDLPWIKATGYTKKDLPSSAKDLIQIKKLLPTN